MSSHKVDNLLFSDWHIGNRHPKKGVAEMSVYVETVIQQIEPGSDFINVYSLGDMIDGTNHGMTINDSLELQIAKGIDILHFADYLLKKKYPGGVRWYCIPGNHGRMGANGINTRYTHNAEMIIYKALPFRTEKISPIIKVGHVLAIHGDYGIGGVFPNSSVFEMKTNSLMSQFDCSVLVMGHFHVPTIRQEANMTCIINGALKDPGMHDEYSGFCRYRRCQIFFETHGPRVTRLKFLYV